MDVSILFATCNRDEILKRTLDSLCQLNYKNLNLEILVIDNAVKTSTKSLVESYHSLLPIQYLEQSVPGKNHALNKGLSKASGELLVFTDDDIIATPEWIQALLEGSNNWPNHDLFGGKILPDYPPEKPDPRIDFNHSMIPSAYVILNKDIPESEISVGMIWGPNMAVRKRVFDSGFMFDPNIGPNGKNYVMGSETDFLYRAADAGYRAVYIPNAVVSHQIRPEQLTIAWVTQRAFRQGKGFVAIAKTKNELKNFKMIMGAPRFLYKKIIMSYFLSHFNALTLNKEKRFHHLIHYHYYKGQFSQYKIISKEKLLTNST